MRPVQLDGLEEVLHLLVLLCVDRIVQLVNEKVVVLLLVFLVVFLLESLEVFFCFFEVGLTH